MKQRTTTPFTVATLFVLLTVMVFAASAETSTQRTPPERTPRAPGSTTGSDAPDVQATRDAIATRGAGAADSFEATRDAALAGGQATIEAYQGTVEAAVLQGQATLEAVATQFALIDPTAVAATLQAWQLDIDNLAEVFGLTPEQAAALEALIESWELVISQDAQTVTFYNTVTEMQINNALAISESLPTGTTVDLIPGGAVLIIPGLEYQGQVVTVSIQISMYAFEGQFVYEIQQITIGGTPVPAALYEEYVDDFAEAIYELSALYSVEGNLPAYTLDSLLVTDNDLSMIVTLYYSDLIP